MDYAAISSTTPAPEAAPPAARRAMSATCKLAALAAACVMASATWGTAEAASPPSAVTAAGYTTETFATVSNFTPQTVDMNLTDAPGYQWYFFNFFGQAATSALTTLNADGSVTTAAFTNNSNATMSSAAQISAAPYFRGTAFGGGGYFEATLSFDAAAVNTSTGWPSWWTMSLEHLSGLSTQQWKGQASGYDHFIEPDIFEADLGSGYPNAYGGNVHDWYGAWNSKACPSYCNVQLPFSTVVRTVPSTTNFSSYHRYGLLWIPATASKKGSLTYYFDGVQVGPSTTYSQFSTQKPVPSSSTPWTFGVVDQQHLVLILGAGASTPMQVQSVTVWQASTKSNMHN